MYVMVPAGAGPASIKTSRAGAANSRATSLNVRVRNIPSLLTVPREDIGHGSDTGRTLAGSPPLSDRGAGCGSLLREAEAVVAQQPEQVGVDGDHERRVLVDGVFHRV